MGVFFLRAFELFVNIPFCPPPLPYLLIFFFSPLMVFVRLLVALSLPFLEVSLNRDVSHFVGNCLCCSVVFPSFLL